MEIHSDDDALTFTKNLLFGGGVYREELMYIYYEVPSFVPPNYLLIRSKIKININ